MAVSVQNSAPAFAFLPYSPEAEQAAIGAALMSSTAVDSLLVLCRADDFYYEPHRLVYTAIAEVQRREGPVDLLTIPEELRRTGTLDRVGGLAYISQVAESVPTAAHADSYCKTVAELSGKRRLYHGCDGIKAAIVDGAKLDDLAFQVGELSDQALRKTGIPEPTPQRELAIARYEAALDESPTFGVATGLRGLDEMTNGWQSPDLILVGGLPSMGKSALMVHFLLAAALAGAAVLVFSLEMSKQQLTDRALAYLARLDSKRLRHRLNDAERASISLAAGALGDLDIAYDDCSDRSVLEMRAIARRWRRKHSGPALVLTDYLQLIKRPDGVEKDVTAYENIAYGCKALAKELRCPHITLSQLSRSPASRKDRRPILQDFRGSGGIEAAGDVALFIHREAYYERQKAEEEGRRVGSVEWPQPTEIIVAKNRNGDVGTVWCQYDGPTSRFDDIEGRYSDADIPPMRSPYGDS